MNKSELRSYYKKMRSMAQQESFTPHAIQSFHGYLAERDNPSSIGVFHPFGDEIDVLSLPIHAAMALPRIGPRMGEGGEMQFHQWGRSDDVQYNDFGIAEPLPGAAIIVPDCVLLPLLACDISGNRLGYGGGFYDRYLARYPHVTRIGVGYDCQLSERPLPAQAHDIPLNAFLSPAGLIEFTP